MESINNLSDSQLIDGVKAGSDKEQCLKELVARHSGIYITMVNNYSPSPKSSIPSCREDLISDKNYYIYQAALKYDSSKNTKFSTYLGNETRWLCLNIYNKCKNSKEFPTADLSRINPLDISDDAPTLDTEMLRKILALAAKEPDRRVSKIFKMRYIDGEKNKVMPWNKVCKYVNLSIQGCINVHNKALKKIKQELKNEL